MKKQLKTLNILLLAVLMAVLLSAPAQAASYWTQKFLRVSATAGETLAVGNVVTIKDADGYAYKADANDAALRPAVGVIGKGGASGAKVEIVVSGILAGQSALTESSPGYLSETAGAITQSAPAYAQQVGYAVSATEYVINCQNYFDSSSLSVLGTLSGASPLVLEGATADAFETTIAVTDPTADRTVTLPDVSGVPILSSAIPDAAKAVSGADNALVFEGATADAHETTLDVADPTADVIYRLSVAAAGTYSLMSSSLATNAPDIANSVSGASNALVFEGATADAFETSVTPTDPTADRTVTLADASGTVMLSTLATNAPDAANSVSGASNGLVFEGATANAHETTVTVTDPTADRTVTIPDRTGQVQIASAASVLTPGAAVTLTVGLSNVYTDLVTDNEDQTITFSGAGTAGDEITIIFTTAGAADEVITFHATLVSSVGTLTLGTDAGKYYVVRFISDGTHWYEVSRTAVQT